MWEALRHITQTEVALIAALLGGTGLKLIEYYLNKPKQREDMATAMRSELRTDLNSCKEDRVRLQKELDQWKERYYDLLEDSIDAGMHVNKNGLRDVDRNDKP